MKRIKLLTPLVLPIISLTPVITLASCGNNEKIDVAFTSIENAQIIGETKITVKKGAKWSNIEKPLVLPAYGYKWTGWSFEDGSSIKDDYVVDKAIAVKPIIESNPQSKVIITFYADRYGKFSDTSFGGKYNNVIVDVNTKWSDVEAAIPESQSGWMFKEWVDQDKKPIQPTAAITDNMFVKATYTPIISQNGISFQNASITKYGEGVEVLSDGSEVDFWHFPSRTLDNKPVIGVAPNGFSENESARSLLLPESLIYIADEAFSECQGIHVVNIPKTVKFIGTFAFSNCQLQEVDFGDKESTWIYTKDEVQKEVTFKDNSTLANLRSNAEEFIAANASALTRKE